MLITYINQIYAYGLWCTNNLIVSFGLNFFHFTASVSFSSSSGTSSGSSSSSDSSGGGSSSVSSSDGVSGGGGSSSCVSSNVYLFE